MILSLATLTSAPDSSMTCEMDAWKLNTAPFRPNWSMWKTRWSVNHYIWLTMVNQESVVNNPELQDALYNLDPAGCWTALRLYPSMVGASRRQAIRRWQVEVNSYLGLVELVTDADTPSGRSSEQCILLLNDLNSLNTM
jgi:hypothetical protein